MLPDRSATSHRNDRRQALPLLRGGKGRVSKLSAEEAEGEMAMISPETQTSRLLRKTANLLNSVAEAAWTADATSPTKWDLRSPRTGGVACGQPFSNHHQRRSQCGLSGRGKSWRSY